MTTYRHAHEEYGRVWFTWDGLEIYSFDDMKFWLRVHPLHAELKAIGGDVDQSWDTSMAIAEAEGQESVGGFRAALDRFLGLDARAATTSAEPVIRALAMLDRRVGRRTVTSSGAAAEGHPFVRRLRDLRLDAEGWASRDRHVTFTDAD